MTGPPVFSVAQPDGTEVLIDLSAPGAFGDFAFRVTTPATGRIDYFDAYHTGEASIFLDVLHALAYGRPPQDVLDDVERIRGDVRARTENLTATTISQNSFEWLLHRVPHMLLTPPATTEYRATDSGRLTLEPLPGALRFEARSDSPLPTDPQVDIPIAQLWQFATGMTWRSYSDNHSVAPLNTRLCTDAFGEAMATLETVAQRASL